MAGHSKWANIKFKKAAADAKRGKIFTKLIREVTIAARESGSDLASNPRLRLAVDKAKAQSVPKDNIDRAIKRGAGELEGESYEEIRYEGYGPGGAAVMVDTLTDNRNRTVAEVRHAFSKFAGNLGADGSVGYLFEHVGSLSYPPDSDEEAIMEAAIEAGASDVVTESDGSIEVVCEVSDYASICEAMTAAGLEPEDSEITMRPQTRSGVDEEAAETLLKLLDALEDLDDVQQVYTNADFPDGMTESSA